MRRPPSSQPFDLVGQLPERDAGRRETIVRHGAAFRIDHAGAIEARFGERECIKHGRGQDIARLRAREAHRGRSEQEIDCPALKRAYERARSVRPLRDRGAGVAKEDMRGKIRVDDDGGADIAIGVE